MTPFQEFRLWARRAPVAERGAAAAAAALVLAVLIYVLVPSSDAGQASALTNFGPATGPAAGGTASGAPAQGTTGSALGGTAGGAQGSATGGTSLGASTGGTTGTTGTTGGASAGGSTTGGTTGTTGGGTTGGGPGAGCPAGKAPGVTASQMKIAVVLVNIAGPAANSLFGVATPDTQQAWANAAIQDVNASGGAGCRKITAQYFKANPTDQADLQKTCNDVQDSGAFAVLDGGAYANFPLVDCYAKAGIPYFGGYLISGTQRQKYYPYLFELQTADRLYRDTELALKSRGFFDAAKGFKKLGFIYRSCDPTMIANQKQLLASIVGSTSMVTYDVGCPSALANPSDIQQAVLTFQRSGVTNVTTAALVADFATFTKIAQQQNFKPIYGLPDDSLVALSYGSQAPDTNNIANAIAISGTRSGDEKTPGTKPNPGTTRCNAAFKKYGNLGDVYKLPQGAGNTCDLVSMFDAAVDHAPAMQRNALAAGLQRAGAVDWSFPGGPTDFSHNGETTGGEFWRPLQFKPACTCWQVIDRTFKPTFG